MSKGGRFARIARDLEKLPAELIEPVLADLEYGQIVRVSQFGGPRVTWAIENSPTWSRFFRGNLAVQQQLDDLTNEIITLCYATGGFKNSPWYWQLSFLRNQKHNFRSKYPTDWASQWASIVRGKLQSVAEDLSPNFAETAYFLSPAGGHHRRPLNPSETEEVEFFIHTGLTLRSLLANEWPKGPPTLPVMARWIALYKRVRHARIAAQAAELDRLVALHERHADRVKQPWAPQTRRPNPDHVIAGLRREAARLKRRNVDGRIWHGRELSGYRFRPAFAALVPYDWCLRLFCEVLKRHPVPEEEGLAEGRGDEESVYPQKVLEMMQEVLEGLPSFYHVYGEKMLDPSRPETLRTARTPWSVSEPADGKEGTFLTKKARGKNPFPHSDNEIRWLETFVEVILWMEEHFPSLVNEVRGEEWENCHEVEVAKIRREERKRRKQEIVQKARSGESNKGSTT